MGTLLEMIVFTTSLKCYLKMHSLTGQGLVMEKKSTSLSSPILNSGSLSSPKFSSMVSPTAALSSSVHVPLIHKSIRASSAQASSLLKRKTESRKGQHSASLPTSKIRRHAERNKGMGNIGSSTRSLSLLNHHSCPSSASPAIHWSSESLSSSVCNKQTSIESNDAIESSDLQSNLQNPLSSPNQYSSQATPGTCYVGSLSAKSIRPSGLRPPSPQIRFFDEVGSNKKYFANLYLSCSFGFFSLSVDRNLHCP